MPKKKQVTLQNSIQGKFIPRNAPSSESVFPSNANDNRFNTKMAELLASSSTMNYENEVVSTRPSQNDQISNEMISISSPRTHSKLFHRRIATMLETMRKPNDDTSQLSVTSYGEYKSQPITFGQLRQATMSSVSIQILDEKSSSYQTKKDSEEKQDRTLTSFVKDNSSNSNATVSRITAQHQLNKEKLYYSPSLEQLLERQNITADTKSDEKEAQKPLLTVDEILALHYSQVKVSTAIESKSPSSTHPNATTPSFYIRSSIPAWNSLHNNTHAAPSPQLIFNEKNRNRPPPPSYSPNLAYGHYMNSTVIKPIQHLIHPSVSSTMYDNTYAESPSSSSSRHRLEENSSFFLSKSTSSLTSTVINSTINDSSRPPPPRYQSPTSNLESSQATPSQQSNIVNNDDSNNNKPKVGFDLEFSRFLYGKETAKTRRQKQRRKAFSDPVKKYVEEASRVFEKTRRRVTTNFNKTVIVNEEDGEADEDNDIKFDVEERKTQKQALNFLQRRRPQRYSALIEKSRMSAKESLVPANPSLKQRIPSFLRVYSQASSSNDILLQWELFNISELETFYTMMSRLYKNENLARVQLYEIYRTVLISVLASKTSFNSDNQHGGSTPNL